MFSPRSLVLLTTALSAVFSAVAAAPFSTKALRQTSSESSFWMGNLDLSLGTVWMGQSGYTIFRDVTKYGATGDGTTDDTAAIQKAIADGNRCGFPCNSTTLTPAVIYFPGGKTYLISKPLDMYYMTQMIGDATNKPVLKASPSFSGMALLDADPYQPNGENWYINQNNFYRQVRNFVIDLTGSTETATGIHWQVAQATSLQNIDFKMSPNSQQQGVFMDNGSGGYMSDLTFEGGKYGAFLGSQQFTTRNLNFTNVETAIYMNWDWGWTFSNIYITGSNTGIDMSNSPANQTVGSVVLTDSVITDTTYGVKTAYGGNSSTHTNVPHTGGTLVLDNVDMSGVTHAAVCQNATQSVILAPGKIETWVQGNSYDHSPSGKFMQDAVTTAPTKAASLLNADGQVFGRSKPQYENLTASDFLLAKKDGGCHGDGQTDDAKCIESLLNSASSQNKVVFFEHGAYLIGETVNVPKNVKMTGEIWPLIMADGSSSSFNNAHKPQPVFRVGNPGDSGAVEISDLIFQTKGPAPGAILVEWNLDSAQGQSGMWDTHARVGGSAGTDLSVAECRADPTTQPSAEACSGVFLMFHATKASSGVYLENNWFWVADHDLEVNNQTQISIYSGRGVLVESHGPVWMWGAAAEHSLIYNYQIKGVNAFFGGFMQTETPYFQPKPMAPAPLVGFNTAYDDPNFTICPASGIGADGVPCKDAWGLRIWDSKGVLIYATGLYSFFTDYEQSCVQTQNCQEYMLRIQNSQVNMYTVTTKAAVNMIADDRYPGHPVKGADNRNVFGDTLAWYSTS